MQMPDKFSNRSKLNFCVLDKNCRILARENEPEENFDEDKLVLWFQINLKMLKHINYEEADPEWIEQNPHI